MKISSHRYYFLIISILLVQTKGFYLVTQKEWRDISANLSDTKKPNLENSTTKLHLNVHSSAEKLQNEEDDNFENILTVTNHITTSIQNLINETNTKIHRENSKELNENVFTKNSDNKVKRIFHRQINTNNLDENKMNSNKILHSAGDMNDLSETKSVESIQLLHGSEMNYKNDLNEPESKLTENSDIEEDDTNLLERDTHIGTVETLDTQSMEIPSNVNTESQDNLPTHIMENMENSTTIESVIKNIDEDHIKGDSKEDLHNGTDDVVFNEVPTPLPQVQYTASKEIESQTTEDNKTTTHFEQEHTTEVRKNEHNTTDNQQQYESTTLSSSNSKQDSEEKTELISNDDSNTELPLMTTLSSSNSKQESEEKIEFISNDDSNTELPLMTTLPSENEIETKPTVPTVYQEDENKSDSKILHKKEIKFDQKMLEEENISMNPTTLPEELNETSSPISKKYKNQVDPIEKQENETESNTEILQNNETEVNQTESKEKEIKINSPTSQEEKSEKNQTVVHEDHIENTKIMLQEQEIENESKITQDKEINGNSPVSQGEIKKHSKELQEDEIELNSTITNLVDTTNEYTTDENLTPSHFEHPTETNPTTTPEESTMIVSTTCENPTENTPMTTVTATTEQYSESTKKTSDMNDFVEKYKKLSEIPYNDIRNDDDGYPPIIELGTSPLHDNFSMEKFRYERDHGIGYQSETDLKSNSKENSGKFLYHPMHNFGSSFGNFQSINKENLNLNSNSDSNVKVPAKLTTVQVDQDTNDAKTTEDPFLSKLEYLNSPPLLIDLSALKKPGDNHKNVHNSNSNTRGNENSSSNLHVNPKENSETPTNLYSSLDNVNPTAELSPEIRYDANPNVENYGNSIVSKPKSSILKKLSSSTLLQNLSQRNRMPNSEQENHKSLIGKISRNSPTAQRASFSNLKASNIDFMKNLKRETVNVPKKPELSSAERAEKLSQAFEKFMQVVHVVGEVDNYFSNRVKSSIKRLAKLCDDEHVI